jgi:ADP-ribose pyrophosphatase
MKEFDKGSLLDRKVFYSGRIVGLHVDQIEVRGIQTIREVVSHPGGVVVLAEVEGGRIPFVRQHRYPIDKDLLELPAGKIDHGEDPQLSAARELEEETGYRAESLKLIFSFYSSPGFCDELLHFFYTNNVQKTVTNYEHDEEIVLEFYTLSEAISLILEGKIQDGKSIAALLWLYHHRYKNHTRRSMET